MKHFIRNKTSVFVILILFLVNILFSLILIKPKEIMYSENSLQERYISCIDNISGSKGSCFRKISKGILNNYSIADLEKIMSSLTSDKRQLCHEFMHYIGWELYQKTGKLFDAFSQASSE